MRQNERSPSIRAKLSCLLLGLVMVYTTPAWAPTVAMAQSPKITRVVASADAFVTRGRAATNFGTRSRLKVGGDPRAASYLRFRVRGLPGRAVKVLLSVYAVRGSPHGFIVRGVTNGSWKERRITFDNRPRPRSRVRASGPVRRGRWKKVDVTSLISGNGSFSIALTSGSGRRLALASRETKRRPKLIVRTVPIAHPVLMAAGDIACDPASKFFKRGKGTARACRMRATSDLLAWNRSHLAGILPLGDLQYENGALSKFRASYHPTWGRVRAITMPSPGNHEYVTPGAAGYFAYFAERLAEFGEAAGDPARGYYSFDIGDDWHVIALNSNCDHAGGCDAGSPQVAWLLADLAANPAPCTLAFWHHPRFSSGRFGNDADPDAFWDALHAAGADVILNGHDHLYERFAPQTPSGDLDEEDGIRQFTVGTGGKNFHGWSAIKTNSEVRSNDTYGVLELTLRPDGYDWRFVPEAGKKIVDSGSASCHGAP